VTCTSPSGGIDGIDDRDAIEAGLSLDWREESCTVPLSLAGNGIILAPWGGTRADWSEMATNAKPFSLGQSASYASC